MTLPDSNEELDELISRHKQALQKSPDDGQQWALLALVLNVL